MRNEINEEKKTSSVSDREEAQQCGSAFLVNIIENSKCSGPTKKNDEFGVKSHRFLSNLSSSPCFTYSNTRAHKSTGNKPKIDRIRKFVELIDENRKNHTRRMNATMVGEVT